MTSIALAVEPVESLLQFDGMIGVLALPGEPRETAAVGVVIVVGGPQTRVGSHRQFVTMARALARAGFPCLRFDYTGMGDSAGPMPDFEKAGPDIRRACDALLDAVPGCQRIALWGLCEGASAALFHARADDRVCAVVAANPWARSEATHSAALVSQHYGSRLRSREFWKKLATGRIDVFGSLREAATHLRQSWRAKEVGAGSGESGSLPARVARALLDADRPVHLQLSGDDLTAAEFELAMQPSRAAEAPKVSRFRLEHADHTCSNPDDWDAVITDTIGFLRRPGTNRARNPFGNET